LFNSGYDANLSLLSSILLPGDVVMVDELCHNSIMMGITASRLQTHATFRHNCLTDLERQLRGLHSTSTYSTYNNHCIVIVVESVYSMDGDVAPLTQLLDLAEKYHASVIVDEAHGLGIYGTTNPHDLDLLDSDEENVEETTIEKSPPQSHAGGTGVLAALHLQHHPALLGAVYTFGKAAGCHGAVICGPNVLIQYLWNYARPLVYSTALPRHSLVCIRMAHETLLQADQQRNHLFELVRYLRHLLYKTLPPGIQLHPSPSPIQALLIPGNDACQQVCQHLYRHHHIRLYPIRAPTVPVGQERIRIVLHAYNTRPEVESLCRALRDTFQALGLLRRAKL
jgi:8-amino-7-oxononanoate synthase